MKRAPKETDKRRAGLKNRSRRTGIFFRTFVMSVLMMTGIIAIFAGIAIPRQRNAILKSMEAQARSVSSSISQVCGNAIIIGDYSFIVEHSLNVVRQSPNILYVTVVREDGFSLIHTDTRWRQTEQPDSQWHISPDHTAAGRILYSDLVRQEVFHYSFPLKYSVLQWGWLHIGLSLEDFNKEIKTMYMIMSLLSLFCLSAGMVAAYVFARRLTRPILMLCHATDRIAYGDLSARADIRTGDEIEDLAISFNKMTQNLQETTVSKNFVNDIIENMSESLVVTTSSGKIRMVNQATLNLLGYREEELSGQPLEMLFANEIPAWQRLDGSLETEFLSKTGRTIPVIFSAAVMEDRNEVRGVVCVSLNIEDRKIAEKKLRQAYEELKEAQLQLVQSAKLASIGELVAGIAHELNQPLMVIRTNAQLILRYLRKTDPVPDRIFRYTEPIERNTKRMMNIINHLRSFSRQSGVEFSFVDINEIVESSFMMISEQLRIHSIEVRKNLMAGLPPVYGNANQLEQVFLNLITNARDAVMAHKKAASGNSAFSGKLEIITRVADAAPDRIEVQVRDNGCGIPSETLPQIFDPFYTTKEVGKGTGLGLSISYGIIRDHKGTIAVSETGPAGTTFVITLPSESEKSTLQREVKEIA